MSSRWVQRFHVHPEVGLLNDPNGMVWHNGVYQLFYQWHPDAPKHAMKRWAHLTSTDMVNFERQSSELVPGDWYDSHGCYSGSGIVIDDQVKLYYTGNVRFPDGGRQAYQCLATIEPDGSVVKSPENPLIGSIPGYTAHIRDPKVWAADGAYWMVLGAQSERLTGAVLLLRSDDALDWQLVGQINAESPDFGYMCECPDLVRLGGRDVLVFSPQFDFGEPDGPHRYLDRTDYAVGDLDYQNATLAHGAPRMLDFGPDFYAPQTMVDGDGRTILVAWMAKPDHVGQPTLAEKHATVADGWVHCLTVPRLLELDGDVLVQRPLPGLQSRHTNEVDIPETELAANTSTSIAGVGGTSFDLELDAEVAAGATLRVQLRVGAQQSTTLILDPQDGRAILDRTDSGHGERGVFQAPIPVSDRVSARVLGDESSLEVFLDGGRAVFSARIYPDADALGISFSAEGGQVKFSGSFAEMMAG